MLTVKMGASYVVSTTKQKSAPSNNVILDMAKPYIWKGLDKQPSVGLGVSFIEPSPTQTGLLKPILATNTKVDTTTLIKTEVSPDGSYTIQYLMHQVIEYLDDSDEICEVGIDGFSRALIRDVNGNLYPISVNWGDLVTVDTTFTFIINPPQSTVNVIDKAGLINNPNTPVIAEYHLDDTKGQWWWLLAGLKMDYLYTNNDVLSATNSNVVVGETDTAFVSTYKPANPICYGFIFTSDLLGAFLTLKFKKPLDFMDGQVFKVKAKVTWK